MCEVTRLLAKLARHCPVASLPGCRSLREPAPTHSSLPRPSAPHGTDRPLRHTHSHGGGEADDALG
eukprot:4438438-Prymnesium_polylepis.1